MRKRFKRKRGPVQSKKVTVEVKGQSNKKQIKESSKPKIKISNVKNHFNPINEIAKLAHKYGAYVIVDAAQMAAHVPIYMSGFEDKSMEIDALLFSGHKTYAPGSPGVIIARKSFMESVEPEDVGGGMVDKVFPDNYFVSKNFPDREEAGTPNILGAITLGVMVQVSNAFSRVHGGFALFLHNWTTITELRSIWKRLHEFEANLITARK